MLKKVTGELTREIKVFLPEGKWQIIRNKQFKAVQEACTFSKYFTAKRDTVSHFSKSINF